jgi:hypothetical protein
MSKVVLATKPCVVLRDAPPTTTRVEFSGGGRISAVELTKMLEPDVGALVKTTQAIAECHALFESGRVARVWSSRPRA